MSGAPARLASRSHTLSTRRACPLSRRARVLVLSPSLLPRHLFPPSPRQVHAPPDAGVCEPREDGRAAAWRAQSRASRANPPPAVSTTNAPPGPLTLSSPVSLIHSGLPGPEPELRAPPAQPHEVPAGAGVRPHRAGRCGRCVFFFFCRLRCVVRRELGGSGEEQAWRGAPWGGAR